MDKETGTLGERTRTLFKEQGITILSILTVVGMATGVLIEALSGGPAGMATGILIEAVLGGPKVSTTKSGNNSGGDKKGGGAREWEKNN